MKRTRSAYPWAYRIQTWEQINRRPHPLRSRLSARGQDGLAYAAEIAGAARARSFAAIGREHPDYDGDRVTADVLARESDEQLSAATIRSRIQQAQIELFGHRSDRSIRRLLARIQHEPTWEAVRLCEADGCDTPLPVVATSSRRFCKWHAQPWAKAARARAKQQAA